MDEFALARVLHVLGVVLWIGGVAMVTTVILPTVARINPLSDGLAFFDRFRRKFAAQARYTTLLVGASGFYMVYVQGSWQRFTKWDYWWMHTMVLTWLIFTIMLFVIEPRARKRQQIHADPMNSDGKLTRIQRMHWMMLTLSLITVAGAVAGSHGWLIFGV
jgi:uncharacterized membrane protein